MKIDRSRLRKSTSEVPLECQSLIDHLQQCSRGQLLIELSAIKTWVFGKCELYHWIPVLDVFDTILEDASGFADPDNRWALRCDFSFDFMDKSLLLWTLHFTTLLIEHSFSRHLYNSIEHLLTLLNSHDMRIVLGVLNLLYMFSKRSNFITRLSGDKKDALTSRLHYLAESWGGKENGLGMPSSCHSRKPIPSYAMTLHFEYAKEHATEYESSKYNPSSSYIHIENIHKYDGNPSEIMKTISTIYYIPPEKEVYVYSRLRLAYHYSNISARLQCIQARLQALSVLAYSNALQDSGYIILYDGLLEELVELVQFDGASMVDIRSAALRTLTAIIHLDRLPHFPKKACSRLSSIIDATGANQYHGFLPTLVRNCISYLTKPIVKTEAMTDEPQANKVQCLNTPTPEMVLYPGTDTTLEYPLPLATSLFSFLYHLASYEAGGEALVACGVLESLLQVINWHGRELEHITFVTRAVRVIDLITNMDMQAFQSYGGLQIFINRLDAEVHICRPEQLYEFKPVEATLDLPGPSDVEDDDTTIVYECKIQNANVANTCLPQRAALLKSMLNFLKKAAQDVVFTENIRPVMEGILPSALKHIIANAEYYGASLFLLATDLVTVCVFQDPTLLRILQANGLTDVLLHALLVKEIPVTKEVLGSVPNVFSALCLNARGLQNFIKFKPFERILKILTSPRYLSAMRRRRSSDPVGDTASNFGNGMDELMRHQPSLKRDVITGIVKILHEACQLGNDQKYFCWRAHSRAEPVHVNIQPTNNPDASSDEEEEEDDETSTSSHNVQGVQAAQQTSNSSDNSERSPVPLMDYIHNIMKFLDALLSNNSTDDHCKEFVEQDGLHPLLKILALPNLPVDSPVTPSTHAVASVCKTILNLGHEPKVFKEGLRQLCDVLKLLQPTFFKLHSHKASILLKELATAPRLETAFHTSGETPILHNIAAVHGYIVMFVHICRTGQSDIRSLSLQHWGSETGIEVLRDLCKLYKSLVWESTLLLAICTEKLTVDDLNIGQEFLELLKESTPYKGEPDNLDEFPSTSCTPETVNLDGEAAHLVPTPLQLKYIKPLLCTSSRLGRSIAELFSLLVKLSAGNSARQRRTQNLLTNSVTSMMYASNIAIVLTNLIAFGMDYRQLPQEHSIKYKLTYLVCNAGFASALLFDEKRYPYHLLLHKFIFQGGLRAFFHTFKWVLSMQGTRDPMDSTHQELPEGTGEFLDTWLIFLEKMVNAKTLLESPFYTPGQTANTSLSSLKNLMVFNPWRFLVQIHKSAFDTVLCMWGKKPLAVYGLRICESMLTILRHILKADRMVKERLNKGEDASVIFATQLEGNGFLRQLTDMGFSHESAMEAAGQTLTVEEATDYLLLNQVQRARSSGIDMDIDEQILQAIALSLGEPIPSVERREEEHPNSFSPLSEEEIDKFTENVLPICLNILKEFPDTIYKICELMSTIMKRSGPIFQDKIISTLVDTINAKCRDLLLSYYFQAGNKDFHKELHISDDFISVGNYTHLYTLFFEIPANLEIRNPCAFAIYRSKLAQRLAKMIAVASCLVNDGSKIVDFQWLTPILLLLDVYEKVAASSQRKQYMHQGTSRLWKWYDLATGKWNAYSPPNNKVIDDAYWNGEQTVRVTCGRRRYTITFGSMLQCNEETGSNRAVAMTSLSIANDYCIYPPNQELNESMSEETATLTQREKARCTAVEGLTRFESVNVVKSCARLLNFPIGKDVLHAILRLCVRFTRDYRSAKAFAAEGGVKFLLKLKSSSGFPGCGTLITVLIRHLLEEPQTLIHSFEKVIRGKAWPSFPPGHRELLYLFRHLEPAITRCPSTFLDVAQSVLRVDISIFKSVSDVDSRLPLRAEPSTRTEPPFLEEVTSLRVIYELLNCLLQPIEEPSQMSRKVGNSTLHRELFHLKVSDLFGSTPASYDLLNMDIQDDVRISPRPLPSDKAANVNTISNERPLVSKHAVLKLLADAVVSYGAVAKLITDYVYKTENSQHLTEDCSALTFMFDYLLPITKLSDRDCSMICRVLIAAIASANHCPEAQSALVDEVKAAFNRAITMPESYKKHNRVQLMTGVITTIIENCPPSNHLRGAKHQSMNGPINNIVKLVLKKGLFNDLCKMSRFMDLSSPMFASTINSSLKAMESLSRIVNQPILKNGLNRLLRRPRHSRNARVTQSRTTSVGATNAQGDDIVEDSENTEHDISAVASSLEEGAIESSSESNEGNRTSSSVSSAPNGGPDVDDEGNVAFESEADATDEIMSTDSDESESSASDQDGDDDNEEDDDDEGEGDNNEDSNAQPDEDVLMVQYADNDFSESLPRMVQWNETGFAMPLFDDNSQTDHNAPSTHPLLTSRQSGENNLTATIGGRVITRPRRYQIINANQRNINPPILQSLLGPVAQNLSLNTSELMNSHARDTGRVMVMDSFGVIPTNEAQIDVVDQSGFLFGPSLLATLNHLPSVLFWWNEEFRLIEDESAHDLAIFLSNKMIVQLMIYRNAELGLRFKKRDGGKAKNKVGDKVKTKCKINSSKTPVSTPQQPITEAYNTGGNETDNADSIIQIDDIVEGESLSSPNETSTNGSNSNQNITTPISTNLNCIEENTIRENSTSLNSTEQNTVSGVNIRQIVPGQNNISEIRTSHNHTTQITTQDRATQFGPSLRTLQTRPRTIMEVRSIVHRETIIIDDSNQDVIIITPENNALERNITTNRTMPERSLFRNATPETNVGERSLSSRESRHTSSTTVAETCVSHAPDQNVFDEAAQDRNESSSLSDYSSESDSSDDSESDESNSHENLSEVERVASEGLADRRAEPNIHPEPFEEPNDIQSISCDISLSNLVNSEPVANTDESFLSGRGHPYLPTQYPPFGNRSTHFRPYSRNVAIRHEPICPLVPYSHQSVGSRWPFQDGFPRGPPQFLNRHPPANLIYPIPQSSIQVIPTVSATCSNTSNAHNRFVSNNDDVIIVEDTNHTNVVNNLDVTSGRNATDSNEIIVIEDLATVLSTDSNRINEVCIEDDPPSGNNSNSSIAASASTAHTETQQDNSEQDATPNRNSESPVQEDIPEGVDRSFLEALPVEIQREVLEQYRIMHSPTATEAGPSGATVTHSLENALQDVNPEFLAALPPAIQEEVLNHQRMEQQRQAAARANPNEPLDAGEFFNTLQPALRAMILSDLEESQIAALPPEVAAEAQLLRRDWEARNRPVQQRFLQGNISTLIRNSAGITRIQTHFPRVQWDNRPDFTAGLPGTSRSKGRARQLLDCEALTCLLMLLFVDDTKLSTLRLHRVIRNLCYHGPTRDWFVQAVLSIIRKTVVNPIGTGVLAEESEDFNLKCVPFNKRLIRLFNDLQNNATWLTIRSEAPLGCRNEIFVVYRYKTSKFSENSCSISIHPRAAPTIFKNAIDLLASLSKSFPSCLLPLRVKDDKNEKCSTSHCSPNHIKPDPAGFWQMLIKLECSNPKKGKIVMKGCNWIFSGDDMVVPYCSAHLSPFGQLAHLLPVHNVCNNIQLTDKVLHVVAVISAGFPEANKSANSKIKSKFAKYELLPSIDNCLSLVIRTISKRACSEEGLEDAAATLSNIARCSFRLSKIVLAQLTKAALCFGGAIRRQTLGLSYDLKLLNKGQKRKLPSDHNASSKGTLIDRFTQEEVIILPSTRIKTACNLDLPSMKPFTEKPSFQAFFLRILHMIVEVREAIKQLMLQGYTSQDNSVLAEVADFSIASLSDQLDRLDKLWESLSTCLSELENTPNNHAVLLLQPSVEAFFLVHAPQQGLIDKDNLLNPPTAAPVTDPSANTDSDNFYSTEGTSRQTLPPDQQKFISFAETHRTVLNQILRQSTVHLADGPFAVLIEHPKVLDFDIKRRYFRTELERMDQALRREETPVHVSRNSVFEDSFRELFRRSIKDWKHRFYIVFDGEEGQDAGGLLREWYLIVSKEIFNPMYALFTTSPGDRVTYMINSASHYNNSHLVYFKFVGRVIAKAIYDNKLLECYFTRSLYKHILGIPLKYTDMESEDYSFYRGLVFLIENQVKDLGYEITFCTEVEEFGVTNTIDLVSEGHKIPVTEDNKLDYVRLSCQMKMTWAIRSQLQAFLEGFYDIIPRRLISIFNEQELELMISGLPNIDIDDLKAHTEYHKYQSNSVQIQWFWRALRSFDQADRAKFLQFVTGTSKVPLQGFEFLEGMNGVQKFQIHRDDRSTERLPSAHTCFNQLDLPVYESSAKLKACLLKAIQECSEGFGFA